MHNSRLSAPPPDLRIIPIDSLLPHEEHDSQRSKNLVEKFKHADVMINPPLVAPINATQYVILDGANRCYTFKQLGYPHILVQVVSYESGYVDLNTWNHIISDWELGEFIEEIKQLDGIEIHDEQDSSALAHVILNNGQVLSLRAIVQSTHERNTLLRTFVTIYQQQARLYRTAINEPDELWLLYPQAIAVVLFPEYASADIIAAAKYQAFLPPGISRHIIHGRALKVNYPLKDLQSETTSLLEKNQRLQQWLQEKLAQRNVRYYAEATYQFDE
ncbi:MAG: hypothetical protein RLP44_02840 [Aggregatilineales bacterium]